MSKKRNKRNSKNFRKKLNNRNTNSFNNRMKNSGNVKKKISNLFGEDLVEFLKTTDYHKEHKVEVRKEIWKEGEKFWIKNFNKMLVNKSKIYSFLRDLKNNPNYNNGKQIYYDILFTKIFYPYGFFGNQTKSWFSDFQNFVDGIGSLYPKSKSGVREFFRVMEKKEFDYLRENGVKGMSWSHRLGGVSTYVKKHFLTKENSENDEMIIVSGWFNEYDITFDTKFNDGNGWDSSYSGNEQEVWLKKNSKPESLFVVGKYTYDDFTGLYKEELHKNIGYVRKVYRETNGIIGDELSGKIKGWKRSSKHDGIIKKLSQTDCPKYLRKLMRNKKLTNFINPEYILEKVYQYDRMNQYTLGKLGLSTETSKFDYSTLL